MLPSVFALGVQNKTPQPTRHNIACGLLDILACKNCRRARKRILPTCCKTPVDSEKDHAKADRKSRDKATMKATTKTSNEEEKIFASDIDNIRFLNAGAHMDLESLTAGPRSSNLLQSRRHSLSTSHLPDVCTIGAYSILKTSPLCQERQRMVSDNLKKQARFSESVSVIVHDLATDQVIKDEIRLKEPPLCSEGGRKSRSIRDLDPKKRHEKPFELDSMDVEYSRGRAYLKIRVFIGAEFMHEKVEIHTAKHGQCLVLVGYKPEPLGDGTNYFRRFMQKFRLTGAVDPYSIDAAMATRGQVNILAPLLHWEDEK